MKTSQKLALNEALGASLFTSNGGGRGLREVAMTSSSSAFRLPEEEDGLASDEALGASLVTSNGGGYGRGTGVAVNRRNYYSIVASRVHNAKSYALYYIFLLALGAIVLVWSIVDINSSAIRQPFLFFLDGLLLIMFAFETVVRYLATQHTFFEKWSNRADVFILTLCAGGLFLDAVLTRDAALLIVFDTVLIVIRTGLVLFRVVHLLKRQQWSALDDEDNQVIMDSDDHEVDPAFDAPFV
eukprot:g4759.t1